MKLKCYGTPHTLNKLIYLLEIEEDIYYGNYNIKGLIKEYKRNGIKNRFNDYGLNELDLIYEKEYNSIKEFELDHIEYLIWF